MKTETYYTSLQRMLDIYEAEARKCALKAGTPEQLESWQASTRQVLRSVIGMDRMERCDLEPQLLEQELQKGHMRQKWLIQVEPGVWMPFYVLVPEGAGPTDPRPAMIVPHGHSSGGKAATAGRYDIPAVKKAIEAYNYTYGLELVKRGFIVFCPDARGFGERREKHGQGDLPGQFMDSTCQQLNHMAICLGRSLTGLWVWDLMRLADYIETRQDCRAGLIGCAGLSGGGMQTMWLSALDGRIGAAVVSGYFYGYRDALLIDNQNCSCNYVPGLWEQVDMGDIGALIAPRPLMIETGDEDRLNGLRGLVNVTEQVEITKRAYALLGAEDHLVHAVFHGGHRWNGEKAYPFLEQHLRGAGA